MSQETVERVYTINLGKVLLSPNNQRAKRAINMIREFAIHHMKSENVKMDEDVSHLVWARGIRHPPRKIRVKLTKDDDGTVLISKYQEEKPKAEAKPEKSKKEKTVEKKSKPQKTENVEEKQEEPKPTKSEPTPEKKSETKEKPKAKSETPKKEEKSEKKTEEKTKTKPSTKSKKK